VHPYVSFYDDLMQTEGNLVKFRSVLMHYESSRISEAVSEQNHCNLSYMMRQTEILQTAVNDLKGKSHSAERFNNSAIQKSLMAKHFHKLMTFLEHLILAFESKNYRCDEFALDATHHQSAIGMANYYYAIRSHGRVVQSSMK